VFDGHTGHGITTAPGPLDTTASFTVSAWVNYGAVSEIAAAVSQLGDVTGIFQLGIGEHAQWWFMMKTKDQSGLENSVWAEGPGTTPASEWTHLVGVSDQEAGVLRLYVDGKKEAETPFDAPLKAVGPMTIGRAQFDSNPGNFWPGSIDSAAAFQTALTDAQVTQLHDRTRPSQPPPPMPAPDPKTYANGILNGTWDFVLDDEGAQLLLEDYADFVDSADEVTVRLGFDDHEFWEGVLFDGELILGPGGVPEGAVGTFVIDGNNLITTESEGDGVSTWTLADNRLTLELVEFCPVADPGQQCERADPLAPEWKLPITLFNHTFTKSSDDPSY
jgi:hypothetical protein